MQTEITIAIHNGELVINVYPSLASGKEPRCYVWDYRPEGQRETRKNRRGFKLKPTRQNE